MAYELKKAASFKLAERGVKSKYPFGIMEVGDAFEEKDITKSKTIFSSANAFARYRKNGYKFSVRLTEDKKSVVCIRIK